MIHYFAYGSNLDVSHMRERCPDSKPLLAGRLSDYRLAFTRHSSGWNCGVADVVPRHGSEVWGLLYEISPNDLDLLDRYEGYPTAYERFQATIFTNARPVPSAWVYSVRDKEGFVAPSAAYVGILKRAAIELHFPPSYLEALNGVPLADSTSQGVA